MEQSQSSEIKQIWNCAGQIPDVYRDSDNGLQYVTTKGGNKVVVGEDTEGRVYFIDGSGNFYYDTGSSELGFYVVSLLTQPTHRDQQLVNVSDWRKMTIRLLLIATVSLLKQELKMVVGES